MQKTTKLARAIAEKIHDDPMVDAIATLGNSGTANYNAEDQLHAWLRSAYGIELEPYPILVTVKSDQPEETSTRLWLNTLPTFEIISAIYECSPKVFAKCMVGPGGMDLIKKYWENAMRQPWGQQHPALKNGHPLEFMLPLQYHYDGAKMFNGVELCFQRYNHRLQL